MSNFKILDVPYNENPVVTINNLTSISEEEVHLVLHEGSAFFSNPIYCELLKREADFLGKTIRVFIPKNMSSEFFENVGIFVEKFGLDSRSYQPSKESSEQKRIVDISQPAAPLKEENLFSSSPLEETIEPVESDQDHTTELNQFLEKSKEIKEKTYFQMPHKTPFYFNKFYLTVALALVLFLIWVFLYLPQAKIILISQRNDIRAELAFRIDKNIQSPDFELKKIPGQVVKIDFSKSLEFPVVSSKNVKEKAKGTITIVNQTEADQTLVPSRFEGPNGKIYWSDAKVNIPANSKITVGLTASNAGEEYNLDCTKEKPCHFIIFAWKNTERSKRIFGQSQEPIIGGKIGQGKIVTDLDLKQAKENVEQVWKKEGIEQLKSSLLAGIRILDEKAFSFNIKEVKSDVPSGTEAEKFSLLIRGEISTMAVKDSDVRDYVNKIIQSTIANDRITYPEKIKVDYKEIKINPQDGIMDIKADITAEIGYAFDPLTVKKEIAGKSTEDLKKYLNSLKEAKKATGQVYLWPKWIARSVPTDLDRITVEIK